MHKTGNYILRKLICQSNASLIYNSNKKRSHYTIQDMDGISAALCFEGVRALTAEHSSA